MITILHDDALTALRTLDAESMQTCVTSPPYWGLRDYGVDGQLGLEKTPEEYVSRLVEIFREVNRVLSPDGTVWLNLGDSYAGGNGRWGGDNRLSAKQTTNKGCINQQAFLIPSGLKAKDLVGIPWRVAFALQADGWYLRSDIIWSKPNPMPESVTDRPTKSHEYIFLLSKSQRYYYDAAAIAEASIYAGDTKRGLGSTKAFDPKRQATLLRGERVVPEQRNKRTVWEVVIRPFPEAHFATFPTEIPRLCILAGTKAGDTVLDPFAGSGTTGKVAIELGRKAILIEPKAEYVEMIERRCKTTIGLPLTG